MLGGSSRPGRRSFAFFMRLQSELALTYLFISHDLTTVRSISDRVAIRYLGEMVEIGPRDAVLDAHRHPYGKTLVSAGLLPGPCDQACRILPSRRDSEPHDAASWMLSSFAMSRATPACSFTRQRLIPVGEEHYVACMVAAPSAGHEDCVESANVYSSRDG